MGLDGVLQLLPPLVAPLLQLVPVVVEVAQLGLDLVGGEVALLDQPLRRLRDGVDPPLVVLDLGGDQRVLLHQVLGTKEVLAAVAGRHHGLLLPDPGLLVIHIPAAFSVIELLLGF